MIAFHKQAMIKLNIYENILVSKTGMYYSPVIRFEKILINRMNKNHSPRAINCKNTIKRSIISATP